MKGMDIHPPGFLCVVTEFGSDEGRWWGAFFGELEEEEMGKHFVQQISCSR